MSMVSRRTMMTRPQEDGDFYVVGGLVDLEAARGEVGPRLED